MSGGPVFVTGLADTGKTPLSRMLNERTSIALSRHTQLWRRFDGRFGDLRQARNLERCLQVLSREPAVAQLQPELAVLRTSLAGHDPTTTEVFEYLHARHARRLGKRRWGEQCGAVDTYADRLLQELPTAQVIHLVRDPVESYRIMAARNGGGPVRLLRFTGRWMSSLWRGQRHAARWPDRYLLLGYEALAAYPDVTFRAVCAFLGEPVGAEAVPFGGTRAELAEVKSAGGDPKYAPPSEERVRVRSRWPQLAGDRPRSQRRLPMGG